MTNAHIDDLIEEYALGLLEPDETARADAHLGVCARCRVKVDSASSAAALLALAAEPIAPPAQTGQRLLDRLAASKRRVRPGALFPIPRFNPWPAIAVANLTLTLLLALWGFSLQTQLRQTLADNFTLAERLAKEEKRVQLVSSAGAQIVELAGTENEPGSSGRAYLDPVNGRVWVTVRNLPEVGEGETYQLWLIGSGGPMSAGLFKTTADGRGEIWVTNVADLAEYAAVGVSRERAGGSQQPTQVVVAGGG